MSYGDEGYDPGPQGPDDEPAREHDELELRTSATIGEIATALAQAQAAFPAVKKGRTVEVTTKKGDRFSYSYATLRDIIEATRKPLGDAGLALIQPIVSQNGSSVLITRLLHGGSGEWIEGSYPLDMKLSPQETGSACTYARRYSVSALLNIATEDDDDGRQAQAASKPPAPSKQGDEKSTQAAEALRTQIDQAIKDGTITGEQAQEAAQKHGVGTTEAITKAGPSVLRSMIETLGGLGQGEQPKGDGTAKAIEELAAFESDEERAGFLGVIAELVAERGLGEEQVRALLGLDMRYNVVKHIGNADVDGLRKIVDALDTQADDDGGES